MDVVAAVQRNIHLFLFCFLSLEKLDFAFRYVFFLLLFSAHLTSQVPESVNPAESGTLGWEVVGFWSFALEKFSPLKPTSS